MSFKNRLPLFVFNENSDLKGVIHHYSELENLSHSLLRTWQLNKQAAFNKISEEDLKDTDENRELDSILAELDVID